MGKSGNPQIQTAQAGLAAGIPSIPSTMMSAPAPTGRPANTGLPPGFDIRHIQSGVGNMDMTRASSAAPAPAPAPAAAPAAAPAEPNVFSQAQQYQRQAGGIYGRLGEFEARDVEAPEAYTPERIAAGQLADVDYGQYMNPYTQQVIERGQSDIERQRQLAAQQMGAQAQAAKAFGGSRQAVQAANLAGEYGRMGTYSVRCKQTLQTKQHSSSNHSLALGSKCKLHWQIRRQTFLVRKSRWARLAVLAVLGSSYSVKVWAFSSKSVSKAHSSVVCSSK
jgi:hypothetical protein